MLSLPVQLSLQPDAITVKSTFNEKRYEIASLNGVQVGNFKITLIDSRGGKVVIPWRHPTYPALFDAKWDCLGK
jgi:hypothetical protein